MKKGFTLAEVLMAKGVSGKEFLNLFPRASEPKELTNKLKKPAAFTLAETLITLAIVGIVSALTIPTVVTYHKKKQTITKLKRAYVTLNDAVNMSVADTGLKVKDWEFNIDGAEFYNRYLKKYLITKNNTSYADYQKNAQPKYLNGQRASGQNWSLENPSRANYNAILPDGTVMIVEGCCTNRTNAKVIVFDINGEKQPNKMGHDIFYFYINSTDKTVMPAGYDVATKKIKSNLDCSSKNSYGTYCASVIMLNNWKFPDNYPW